MFFTPIKQNTLIFSKFYTIRTENEQRIYNKTDRTNVLKDKVPILKPPSVLKIQSDLSL